MQIEQLMSKHGMTVEVQGGSIRDGGVHMEAQAAMASGKERLRSAARELRRIFGVDKVDLERSDGRLRFRYRRRPRNTVELLTLLELVSGEYELSVPLGIDLDACPLMLRLADFEGGNVLVAGEEKAGKTSLLRAIVAATALKTKQSDVQILVLGGSGRHSVGSRYSLAPLEHLPHFTAPVQEGHDEAVEALNWMIEEAAYREANEIAWPLLLLVIDDLDSLLFPGEKEVVRLVGQLLDARPDAGIRVLISVNDVMSAEVRALIRHNVGLRLVGRVPGERESRAATGMSGAGAEQLRGGGAFVAVSGGEVIRFQAAFIDDYDLHLAIDKAYERSRRALLALPMDEALPELPEAELSGQEILFRVDTGSGRVVLESPHEEADIGAAADEGREADGDLGADAYASDEEAWYIGRDDVWSTDDDRTGPH